MTIAVAVIISYQLSQNARKQGSLWGAEARRDWAEIEEQTHPILWRETLDAAGIGQSTRVLDAGCGPAEPRY